MAMRLSELTSYPLSQVAPVHTPQRPYTLEGFNGTDVGCSLMRRVRFSRLEHTLDYCYSNPRRIRTPQLSDPSGRRLENVTPDHAQKRQVLVWSDRCEALGVNGHIDRWVSDFLGSKPISYSCPIRHGVWWMARTRRRMTSLGSQTVFRSCSRIKQA